MAEALPLLDALFTASVQALLLAGGGYLLLAGPPRAERRWLGAALALLAVRSIPRNLEGLAAAGGAATPGDAFFRVATALFTLALAAAFAASPPRVALRSPAGAAHLAAGAFLAAGAVAWLGDPGVFFAGGGAGAPNVWNHLLLGSGVWAVLAALLAHALWRAPAGTGEGRAAGAVLPFTLAFVFATTGSGLAQAAMSALGAPQGVPGQLRAVPGDCCGVVAGAWVLWHAIPLAIAAVAALGGSRGPLLLVLAGSVLHATAGGAAPFPTYHVLGVLGIFHAMSRHGALGEVRTPPRVALALAGLVFLTVFLVVNIAGIVRFEGSPLALALGVLAGLVLGALAGVSILPPGTGWLAALGPADIDATRRRLGAYRAALESEVRAGAGSADLSTKLRGLRGELGVSEHEHAVMEYMLRSARGPPGAPLAPGEVFLGRYRVQRALGRGGAGAAFLCRDEALGRPVVLKAIGVPGAPADGLAGVLREARAIGAVRHPRVVTVHDVEQVGDRAFIVMEFLEGGSLDERLRRGALGGAEFRAVALGALEGLEAVHAAGLVHRDVKPSNILLTAAGEPKLADFGIAHLPGFETTEGIRDGGPAVGTIRFMSPEQALGRPATVRSDLFSASAALFEAYTGGPYLKPLRGESAVELQLRAARPRAFPAGWRGPAGLKAWFARALDPVPERRFASAGEMRAALARALDEVSRGRTPAGSGRRR